MIPYAQTHCGSLTHTFPGAPSAFGTAPACCHGDEGKYKRQEGRYDVPQDLHTETRQRQVNVFNIQYVISIFSFVGFLKLFIYFKSGKVKRQEYKQHM